ncbi:uncharacterized protein YjbI with pentapeptide repeats [Roseivirga ehrenbergii]|uniref:MCBG-like protein n=2 Tax=Roseivirga ehrenbergii (strain DSM 102268 / JCM 13514 / KCTC 12282 / NCIMB 14502 / KMM 6017) TaxID=279360 RepID=A0A150XTR6_ROSEK|nr:hypothetical protein MB14_01705 [Roseivirga ehrenbergii]TCL01961.1 uncharacterized protein YjbI with pentapeptide repeats [Roseivirga ehrenbergii]
MLTAFHPNPETSGKDLILNDENIQMKEHSEIKFKNEDFKGHLFDGEFYDECHFVNCDLTGADFRSSSFDGCTFESCNLTAVKVVSAKWDDISFKGCKLSGIDFEPISKMLLSFSFENCQISYCYFKGLKIPSTRFLNSEIKECDFIDTDLSAAIFKGSNLVGSTFVNCNLSKADFREAYGYQFNPNDNRLKKAKFSNPEVLALLNGFDIVIE